MTKQILNTERKWHIIDMSTQTYGRNLSKVATLLCGKHKVNFSSNLDQGDYVVIINANKVRLTGQKLSQKVYYKHTGYLGNLKEMTLSKSLELSPANSIKRSVAGMLPKNKLKDDRLARLKIYNDESHPHQNVKFEE